MGTRNQLLLDQEKFPLEETLTKHVKDWLDRQRDITWYKASDRYTKGISDIIMCVGGIFVAAELKADDGTASPQQQLFINKVKNTKGIAAVCYTLGEVKQLVEIARKMSYALR